MRLPLPALAGATPRVRPSPAIVAGYLVAYVALDWVSYIQPVGAFPITPWNPPPGLSLAFLLHYGPRQGGWLLVAGLAAEWLVRGLAGPAWVILGASALPALVYTALTALVFHPQWQPSRRPPVSPPRPAGSTGLAFAWRDRPFDSASASLRRTAAFLALVLVATGIVAVGLVALYHEAGLLTEHHAEAIAQSWIGDFVGIAVTTPAVLLLARRGAWRMAQPRTWLAPLAAIAAAFWMVFGSGLTEQSRLFYVLFLPLVWIAVQHGLAGAAAAMVLIQVGLVAVLGRQPGALLDYQFLMLALCVTGLLLGTAVSEQRRIERELRQNQAALDRSLRMAAASELASALAHELQQPLMAAGNYVRAGALMAQRDNVPAAELAATMDKAIRETERASIVVRRLRDFFRTGAVRLEPVAPRALATAAVAGVRERLARHDVALTLMLDDAPLPDVQADRIQIEGVLANLLGNAIDALKQLPGERRIRVSVTQAAGEVEFAVEDNGPGVPAETADRLFEHFATSKVHGMGLGLAISRSIVEAHGGRIWHDALPHGAAFRFRLQAAT